MRLESHHWEVLSTHPHIDAGGVTALTTDGRRRVIDDICGAGLWAEPPKSRADATDRQRLFRFAALQRLRVDVFAVPGGTLAAANLTLEGLANTTASGKGFGSAKAVLGCLGEALEIASWTYRSTDRASLIQTSEVGDAAAISAESVLGFAAGQTQRRSRFNRAWANLDAAPTVRQMRRPGLWTVVRSFDESRSERCPAFLCFGRLGEIVYGDSTRNVDSNGCAAGGSADSARLRGMLELVERDATGVWWWRGCRRARLSPDAFDDLELRTALADHRNETGRQIWFLDISTFRSAHVVAAVSCDRSGGRIALGFAAALRLSDAVRSSFLEMIQTELAFDAHEVRMHSPGDTPVLSADRLVERWLHTADLDTLHFLAGCANERPTGTTGDRSCTPHALVEEMSAAGNGLWFADLSRTEFGVPVFKALCPGLAHFKPRWGCERIWSLPELRGWETTFDPRRRRTPPPLLV